MLARFVRCVRLREFDHSVPLMNSTSVPATTKESTNPVQRRAIVLFLVFSAFVISIGAVVWNTRARTRDESHRSLPRKPLDPSGISEVLASLTVWDPSATLPEIRDIWKGAAERAIEKIDRHLVDPGISESDRLENLFVKSMLRNYQGKPDLAYATLQEARALLDASADRQFADEWMYTIIHLQGVAGLRKGENDNCIMCRGDSSCIIPIKQSAIHTDPEGSRLAIRHFTEYLDRFPNDLGVRWLLNVAHMTLGEHPDGVDPRFVIIPDQNLAHQFENGPFRDVGHLVGLDRFNQAGGAIMEDFDNDGLLDVVVTAIDYTRSMAIFRNTGNGKLVEVTELAGVTDQLGGLNCVQADFNNDGFMYIYIPRGAWIRYAIRPTLLVNNGDGTFTDVTEESRLMTPANSNAAGWADFDGDGNLDLFVCCEAQPVELFRNLGDGTFSDVTKRAGISNEPNAICKGVAWGDYDADGDPDLFITFLNANARLWKNMGHGQFTDATSESGIDGPGNAFSAWAWDYDNDGRLDIYASSYDRTLPDIVRGLIGEPHERIPNKLYHNVGGGRFDDVTAEAGLDSCFSAMGSNFADFDNDGWLDMYLGTGEPSIETLVPNRMFHGIGGKKFEEISMAVGTAHLQKGHGVANGDWDRDGDVDVFIELGGFTPGDSFHNVLFQNAGNKSHWIRLRLIGEHSNRNALGTRITLYVDGVEGEKIHRHVTSGSSFGANPLEMTIGIGSSEKITRLDIEWPTSGRKQTFRNLAANQSLVISELSDSCHTLRESPIELPEEPTSTREHVGER